MLNIQEKKAILFINTNRTGSSREALKIAFEMGYHIILLTDRKGIYQSKEEFKYVDEIFFLEKLKQLNEVKGFINNRFNSYTLKLIISFVDGYVYIASRLSDYFCNNNVMNSKSVLMMENKLYTRYALKDKPYNIPFKMIHNKEDLLTLYNMPVVLKKIRGSSSRDLYFIKEKKDLESYSDLIEKEKEWIAEKCITGKQYLLECMVLDGVVTFLCKVRQWSVKKQGVITDYLLNPYDPINDHDLELLYTLIERFSIKSGHFHVEIIQNEEGTYVIEINPRISGSAMNQMIRHAYGFNYLKEILNLYLNLPVYINQHTYKKRIIYTGHITARKEGLLLRIKGLKTVNRQKGFMSLVIKPGIGTLLKAPEHMGHRYGYVIATGDTSQDAIEHGVSIRNTLQIEVEPISLV
ncbi:ATP-grasp domain-containing protein [Haloplasma contractile]|uniref:DNA polymerase III subunit beta protein n=1 Tax=Haloplasma contractile SSD-17B TaxID=1033810 RepID=U2FIQ0_9MOLU|nr:ATP-grasp domain-containing protein [Haloplasma contractile]ERJ11119.1 DNA polymerase III subunit beta protein [Haloplasma contractile SSD-17B]